MLWYNAYYTLYNNELLCIPNNLDYVTVINY